MPTVTPGEQGVLLAGAGGRKNLQILGGGGVMERVPFTWSQVRLQRQGFITKEIRVPAVSLCTCVC